MKELNDEKFLKKVAPYFGINITNFVINPGGGMVGSFNTIIQAVKQIGSRDIIVVVDQDFRVERRTRKGEEFEIENVYFICWDLPSIESYLFVHLVNSRLIQSEKPQILIN